MTRTKTLPQPATEQVNLVRADLTQLLCSWAGDHSTDPTPVGMAILRRPPGCTSANGSRWPMPYCQGHRTQATAIERDGISSHWIPCGRCGTCREVMRQRQTWADATKNEEGANR